MLVGYMRVSSDDDRQTTALQRDALLAAGVDDRHLYEDRASLVMQTTLWVNDPATSVHANRVSS